MRLRQLRCSFCRKDADNVKKLVAGPRVYICDACVAIANRLMDEGSDDGFEVTKKRSSMWQKLANHVRQIFHRKVLDSINPSHVG